MRGKLIMLLCSLLVVSGAAQERVDPKNLDRLNAAFDFASKGGERLKCRVEPRQAFLDFAFRFEAGYIIECPINVFEGKEGPLATFVRITPEGKEPVLLGASYKVPGIPAELRGQTDIRNVKAQISASGVFAVGEGRYTVELLGVDDRERYFGKKWKLKVARRREESQVEVAGEPNTVGPLRPHLWSGEESEDGVRLTVLLDAAPINPNSLKLRAWDRAFLLDSVSSVLRQIPCKSVKLVAFNLEQQREIYRNDHFRRGDLHKLSRSLRELELGTVSVDVLKDKGGWADLLADLSNREATAEDASDVVLFLGPATRKYDKIPKEALHALTAAKPQFFYLEYYPMWRRGSEFPDTIHQLTSQRGGTVMRIHNPGEFATAITRLMGKMARGRNESGPEETRRMDIHSLKEQNQ